MASDRMKTGYGRRTGWRQWLTLALTMFVTFPVLAAIAPMSNDEMSGIQGQGSFLVADRFAASAITGAPAVDGNVTFYRMGLDAQLAMNANINRMQLGCGGINNSIMVGCDIDLSNVSFMGTSKAALSDFLLTRPYIELAILNDGTATRQLVGFNIGAESATGYMSIGRTYANGQLNQETGATCNSTDGNSSTPGAGCHSGINVLSGYTLPTITGYVWGDCANIVQLTCAFQNNHYWACYSNVPTPTPSGNSTACSGAPAGGTVANQAINGTRLVSASTAANANANAGLTLTITTTINLAMAYIHGLLLNGVPDFGFSLQRQQLAWPKYAKTGFSPVANTGWWMSLPNNVVINVPGVGPGPQAGITSLGGITVTDLDLGQVPSTNCYGTTKFC